MTRPFLAVDGFLASVSHVPKHQDRAARLAGSLASCLLHGVLLVLLVSPFSTPSFPTPQSVQIEVTMMELATSAPSSLAAEAEPPPSLLPAPLVAEAIPEAPIPEAPPAVVAPAARPPRQPSRSPSPVDRTRRSVQPTTLFSPKTPSLPQAPPSSSTSDAPAPPADIPQIQAPAALPIVRNPAYRFPPTPPVYPRLAKSLEQQGTVIVHIRIDTAGDPQDVVVFKGSGFETLDKAAVRAAHSWRFQPAQRDGSPIPAWVEIAIHFHLT